MVLDEAKLSIEALKICLVDASVYRFRRYVLNTLILGKILFFAPFMSIYVRVTHER
jgi:hypothetical protein